MADPDPRYIYSMEDHVKRFAFAITVALVLLSMTLSVAGATDYGAFSRPKVAPVSPPPDAATTLSRQNQAIAGTLPPHGSAVYTVDYQPLLEGLGTLAPWLLRMKFTAPGASPLNSVTFTVIDQTNPLAQGSTAGNVQTSVAPIIGGNFPDVSLNVDPSTIQQAILSAASPGKFKVTVVNSTNGPARYLLQLFPLLGGQLESGASPDPVPRNAAAAAR